MPSQKKNNTNRYAPTAWGSNLQELELPSGQLVEVRRTGLQGLIKVGILESLDGLTGLVATQTLPKSQGKQVADMKKITENPEAVSTMLVLMDKIVEHVVAQPIVARPILRDELGAPLLDEAGEEQPLPAEARDPEIVYTDAIGEDDKTFIMNFAVGGTRDFEQFRAQREEALGGAPLG